MTYFYDEDICFTRLGFPHMLSAKNAPPGTGSIQAEVYFSKKYKPFTGSPDDWIEPVIRDLRRCGLLLEEDRMLFKEAMLLRYANIIFDLDRAAALKTVHGYLDDIGDRLLRTIRRLGIHVDRREFQERRAGCSKGSRPYLRVLALA